MSFGGELKDRSKHPLYWTMGKKAAVDVKVTRPHRTLPSAHVSTVVRKGRVERPQAASLHGTCG